MKRSLSSEIEQQVGGTVLMSGWVQTIRRHSKVAFIDLRDRAGLAQVVLTGELLNSIDGFTEESVIQVSGTVQSRPTSLINPNIVSGAVEVQAEEVKLISAAKPLPLPIGEEVVNEDIRLKYRYLDLRRARMSRNLRMRAKINHFARSWFTDHDFVEIETPYISKSTPEGARDYLVPSRIEPGNFYALPQSPQQYKQLLMVAGMERYFQLVRCFRDEDSRKDRQPEFTQLDLELSFASQEEILSLVENFFKDSVKTLFPEKTLTSDPFPHISYADSMSKYGTDRPDLRSSKDNEDELAFCFIVDFPMFEWKEAEKRFDAVHHPFTRPGQEWEKRFTSDPKSAVAAQYDLVLNGVEIGGGSLRIHEPEMLAKVFELLGHSKDAIDEKFGHLLEAFQYGVPPHGGFAAGWDRFVSLIENEKGMIREVIAFPKQGDGHDPMMNAPSPVNNDQLMELGIQLRPAKK